MQMLLPMPRLLPPTGVLGLTLSALLLRPLVLPLQAM
jgi:hypothetical protein